MPPKPSSMACSESIATFFSSVKAVVTPSTGWRAVRGGGGEHDKRTGRRHGGEVGVVDAELATEVSIAEDRTDGPWHRADRPSAENRGRRLDKWQHTGAGRQPVEDPPDLLGLCDLRQHDGARPAREHGEVVLVPRCALVVDPHDARAATCQPAADVLPRVGFRARGDRVLDVEDDVIGAARGRLGEPVRAVAGHEEQRPSRGQAGSVAAHSAIQVRSVHTNTGTGSRSSAVSVKWSRSKCS